MKTLFLLTISMLVGNTFAEFRTWTATDGKELEAEFVNVIAGKVILKGKNGKKYKPAMSSLSEKDLKYLQDINPPEIEVDFSKKQDRRNKEYYGSDISMQGKVTLTKTNRMPYDGELHATLYMFGEDKGLNEYVILDRTESNFNFSDSKTHSFKGKFFRMTEDTRINYGMKYQGFVVVVKDKDGFVVAVESNRKQLVHHYNDFTKLRQGERFSRDLESRSGTSFFHHYHPCYHHHWH